jgi:hypothetical protein
LARALGNT